MLSLVSLFSWLCTQRKCWSRNLYGPSEVKCYFTKLWGRTSSLSLITIFCEWLKMDICISRLHVCVLCTLYGVLENGMHDLRTLNIMSIFLYMYTVLVFFEKVKLYGSVIQFYISNNNSTSFPKSHLMRIFTNKAQSYTLSKNVQRNFMHLVKQQVFLDFWLIFSKEIVKPLF